MATHRKRVLNVTVAILAVTVPAAAARVRQTLADGWYVKQLESANPDIGQLVRSLNQPDNAWLSARMPAQVHEILLAHKLIPDPRLSENAAKVTWVSQKDWAYGTKFRTPAGATGPVFLHLDGLDTLATVYLNGVEIGSFRNMFRQYSLDIRKHLSAAGAENTLLIVFRSPTRYLDELRQPAEQVANVPKLRYLRKLPSDFNSYLGARPNLIKVGIYRDVWLDVPGPAWIDDVWVRTDLSKDLKRAVLRVQVATAGAASSLDWRLVDPSGAESQRGAIPSGAGLREFTVDVGDPKLWWPRSHGTPNLYTLAVSLKNGSEAADSHETKVGIRRVEAISDDPATGEKRFGFQVNGTPVYFRGGCWAPLDWLTHAWNSERARRLFELAEHGNMNIFRFWAEGPEAPREFYDECDRRGIVIWQDFFFAGGMQPEGDPSWETDVRAELEGIVRRLRNHPSLLLWCGGNENHMFVDWAGKQFTTGKDLFHKTMPEVVARLDPERIYHPNSPYGGLAPNWPLEGDWHDYTTIQFEPHASVPAWGSEVLRVSPPSLTSMRRFLTDEEIWPNGWSTAVLKPGEPAWPPAWQYHSTGTASWDRIGPIERLVDSGSPGSFIRALGTAHGEYMQDRIERHRRGVPDGASSQSRRNWGNTVWRFNDPWPMIYSSIVDYYLEPKIAYYSVRRAYQPVLASFEHTPDWIAVWLVNDSPEAVTGKLVVKRRNFDGKVLNEMTKDVSIAPAEARRCLNLNDFGWLSLRDEFLEASFAGSESTHLLMAERYLHLPKATLAVRVLGDTVEISTDKFARQVVLDYEGISGGVFEDNFFDMPPGRPRTVRILNHAGGRSLAVRALNADTVVVSR